MVHTIELGRVLREAVATPYANLVTRPTGAAVRNRIRDAMAQANCPTTLLDFTGIELLDFSCADEIVAKLLLDTAPEPGCYVMLRGLREDHHDAIDHVLTHHAIAIATVGEDGPALLGEVAPDLRRAFAWIAQRGPALCEELAEALAWPAERARESLQALTVLRLIQSSEGRFGPLPVA